MQPPSYHPAIPRTQRRISLPQRQQSFIKVIQLIPPRPIDLVFIEEFQPLVVWHLLPAIDQRKPVPGSAQHGKQFRRISQALVFTAAMRVLIMVRGKINPEPIRRELRRIIIQHLVKSAQRTFLSPDSFHLMQELPGVSRVKCLVIGNLLALRQPEQRL